MVLELDEIAQGDAPVESEKIVAIGRGPSLSDAQVVNGLILTPDLLRLRRSHANPLADPDLAMLKDVGGKRLGVDGLKRRPAQVRLSAEAATSKFS